MIYYNDNEPFAAVWLGQLTAQAHLPAGTIDARSIKEVQPCDLPSTCHFFAGIGGWPRALQLAGWPTERPVWTGSCPCQPFSVAGKRRGTVDERHLWPEFCRLIAECRPPTIFGEQVASRAGREWLAGVRADLEALGYAVGAADLCAASVGAPHIRQRLFWVADADQKRHVGRGSCGARWNEPAHSSGLGDADDTGPQGRREHAGEHADQQSPWAASDWLPCLDGKARRIEPGTFPLADGVPARVGRLRGYGNAIVPQVAAEFVRAFLDAA